MKDRTLVAEALLAGAERAEVLGRLRHDVRAELNDDPAERLVVDGHVEEATGQTHLAGKVARLLRRSGTEYGSDTTTAIIDSRTGGPLRGDTE